MFLAALKYKNILSMSFICLIYLVSEKIKEIAKKLKFKLRFYAKT